jgi:hypothetical protein
VRREKERMKEELRSGEARKIAESGRRLKEELRRRIHLRQGYGATRGKSALSSATQLRRKN